MDFGGLIARQLPNAIELKVIWDDNLYQGKVSFVGPDYVDLQTADGSIITIQLNFIVWFRRV